MIPKPRDSKRDLGAEALRETTSGAAVAIVLLDADGLWVDVSINDDTRRQAFGVLLMAAAEVLMKPEAQAPGNQAPH